MNNLFIFLFIIQFKYLNNKSLDLALLVVVISKILRSKDITLPMHAT